MILFYAGYFVNIEKSVLDPTSLIRHLGIMVDSQNKKFSVPQDRVDNLLSLIECERGGGSRKFPCFVLRFKPRRN